MDGEAPKRRIESSRKLVRGVYGRARRAAACCIVASLFPILVSGAQLSAQQLVRLSIASTEADWKVIPQFSYMEQDEDIKGRTKTSNTYQVWMLDGSPYSRLTEVDGQSLSPAQSKREREKLQEMIARRASESRKERARRLAQYEKDRQRMFALLHEMAQAFDFRLAGEQKLDNYDVYVLQAYPRPGYQPKSRETKILTGMKGTLWIEKSTYQWIRVEAIAIKPVWFEWFIAKVIPGTRFLLQQTRVTQSLWLPAYFSFEARARILWWQKEYFHSESYQDYCLLPGLSAPLPGAAGTPHVEESVWRGTIAGREAQIT